MRLFVGNLPYDATEVELREYFSTAGTVSFIHLPMDRETGRPRGFAFIEFAERAQADEAVRLFNNQPFRDRPLVVNEARARGEAGSAPPPSPRSSSGPSRPYAPRPSWGQEPREGDVKPSRASGRNFGPDALPKHKRKTNKAPKGPKGPIKERGGNRFYNGIDDEDAGDLPADDLLASKDSEGEQDE